MSGILIGVGIKFQFYSIESSHTYLDNKYMIPSSELNITYLLGAGASAQAFPIVRKVEGSPSMSQAFIQVAQQLEQFEYDARHADYIIGY